MSEPTINVNLDQVLGILGAKEVELTLTRQLLAQAQQKLAEYEKAKEPAPE